MKMQDTSAAECYSAIKKSEIMPFAAIQMEVSETQRQISYDSASMRNLKERIQMNLFTEQMQSQEGHSWLPGDKGGEG